ncbi:hypothetical protein AAKU67_004419 [Oxalobacteraceae bacterium GrIS 2.11]
MLTATLSETRRPDFVRRSIVIADKEIWWEIRGPADILPPPLTVHDMAVTATLFIAMDRGEDLHIDGPVSASMLESVEDLVASWVNWCPDFYRPIKVTAAEEVPDTAMRKPARRTAVLAFSGGLDSLFTIWRHASGRAGRRSRTLFAAGLIIGLDIPLDASAAITAARSNAQAALDSINVPLALIRTNWKTEACVHWQMEFGTAVSTCLRNWQGTVDTALVASDFDYRRLLLPWGGNPVTYPMLSTSEFKVVYDGGEFNRTEKAGGIRDWEAGLNNLRVCWEGPVTGYNCGICEKCLKTKLNFLAAHMPLPSSLAGMPTDSAIFRTRAKNLAQVTFLKEIYDIAVRDQIKASWVGALRMAIVKNIFLNRFVDPRMKHLERLNQKYPVLLAPARRIWRVVRPRS